MKYLVFGALLAVSEAYRGAIVPQTTTSSSSETPKPWIRTISSTVAEIVTPTVINGVTFSGKPPAETNGLEPWVSLDKSGKPVTIKPEIKNGHTVKARPSYKTWFQTVATVTYSYEDLKAHNMDADDLHEEEVFLDEDSTYTELNPVMRCTPDNYYKKGIAKNIESAPFCTPREGSQLKVGQTYFVTWYTKHFRPAPHKPAASRVRLHMAYVKESAWQKGMRDVPHAFFSSEWVRNEDGLFPLEIMEEWLDNSYERRVVVGIQPDYVSDEEFDILEEGTVLKIAMGSKVFKKTKEQRALEESGITHLPAVYVALALPTVVVVVFFFMYFFVAINAKYRDFSDVRKAVYKSKHRVIGKLSGMKKFTKMKNHKYSELPTHKTSKQH